MKNINLTPPTSTAFYESTSETWKRYLFKYSSEMLDRPKKNLRSKLVFLGFAIASGGKTPNEQQENSLTLFSEALEFIHTGTLVIDDIQDDSPLRRGKPPLHQLVGMPQALNLGNWMYFEALTRIRQIPASECAKDKIAGLVLETMRDGHLGQAIDLGESMFDPKPAKQIMDIVESSHVLKSGGLVRLALMAGAFLFDEQKNHLELGELGKLLGAALQQFDDLGNIKFQSPDPKALEDLRLGRPNFIWSFLASKNPELLTELRSALLKFPDTSQLEALLTEHSILAKAYLQALENIRKIEESTYQLCNQDSQEIILKELRTLTEKIANAYK